MDLGVFLIKLFLKTIIVLSLDNSTWVVPNPNYQLCKKSDRLLKGWISSTLDDEILPFVVQIKTYAKFMNYLLECLLNC